MKLTEEHIEILSGLATEAFADHLELLLDISEDRLTEEFIDEVLTGISAQNAEDRAKDTFGEQASDILGMAHYLTHDDGQFAALLEKIKEEHADSGLLDLLEEAHKRARQLQPILHKLIGLNDREMVANNGLGPQLNRPNAVQHQATWFVTDDGMVPAVRIGLMNTSHERLLLDMTLDFDDIMYLTNELLKIAVKETNSYKKYRKQIDIDYLKAVDADRFRVLMDCLNKLFDSDVLDLFGISIKNDNEDADGVASS